MKRIKLVKSESGNEAVGIYNNSDWGEYIAIPGYLDGNRLKRCPEAQWYHDNKEGVIETAPHLLRWLESQR